MPSVQLICWYQNLSNMAGDHPRLAASLLRVRIWKYFFLKKHYTALSCQQILSWIVFKPNQTHRQLCLNQVYWQPINVLLIPERMIAFPIAVGLSGWKPFPSAFKQASFPGSGQGCCNRQGGGCWGAQPAVPTHPLERWSVLIVCTAG